MQPPAGTWFILAHPEAVPNNNNNNNNNNNVMTPNYLKLGTFNTLRIFYVFVCLFVVELTSLKMVKSRSLASNARVTG
jgi:hypothetical protein